jgi:hypothetical protein
LSHHLSRSRLLARFDISRKFWKFPQYLLSQSRALPFVFLQPHLSFTTSPPTPSRGGLRLFESPGSTHHGHANSEPTSASQVRTACRV